MAVRSLLPRRASAGAARADARASLEHAVEQAVERLVQAVAQDTVRLGRLLRGADFLGDFAVLRGVALLVPFAQCDQVILQPPDRIAQRPRRRLARRAILGGIVGGGVPLGAIGEMLDQRRALVGPRPLGGPLRGGINRQRVIAVDAQARNAIADRTRGKGRRLRACKTGEAGDRPLVVDDVHDDRRTVDGGEGTGRVEIALRRRTLAAPNRGNAGVALGGRGHRPANGLRILRRQIARDREETSLFRGIHDGQLLAAQPIRAVGIDLVHHVGERPVARDQQPLLAVGGEAHILIIERMGSGDGDRLLAQRLHVEAGLALALRPEHAFVKGAEQHHVAQHPAQAIGESLGSQGPTAWPSSSSTRTSV